MRPFLSALLVAGLVGCGGSDVPPAPTSPTGKEIPAPPSISVEEVSGDSLNAAIAKHKDKVVVVDLWATWCESCVKKFPHFVKMHEKYGSKGLVCISISMDKLTPTTYKKDAVLEFLKSKHAAFPNYVVADPEGDEKVLAKRLGEDYRLIPLMVIYDKAGRKVWSSGDGPPLTDDQLDKKVEELLAQ